MSIVRTSLAAHILAIVLLTTVVLPANAGPEAGPAGPDAEQARPPAQAKASEAHHATPTWRKRRGSSSPPQGAVTPFERRHEDTLEGLRRGQRPDIVRRERRDIIILDESGRGRPLSPPGTIMPTPPSRSRPGNDATTPMSPPGAVLPTPPSMPIPGVR
jgi:hypothetical protein